MTKQPFILLAALLIGLGAAAQSKVDLVGQVTLRQNTLQRKGAKTAVRKAAPLTQSTLRAFITLAQGHRADELEAIDGIQIDNSRGSMVMAQFPEAVLPKLEASAAVKSIRLERPISQKLDRARALSGVDRIHSGDGLPRAYTGRGVIAGIVDGGFDPNHVNFKNADGSSRIEDFCYFRPTTSGSYNKEVYGGDYMPNIDTESAETFHGTHTLGIMAGGYKGPVKAGILTEDPSKPGTAMAVTQTIDNPYYGVVPEASIAIASGAYTDYTVASGVSEILNYAYWKAGDTKKHCPVVVNMSIGSNIGPHDGSATLSKYIDEEWRLSMEDGSISFIPCMSAGNEGDLDIALHKTLSADDLEMKTTFSSFNLIPENYPDLLYGQVYIYSNTTEPFEIQAVIINKERARVALQNVIPASAEGGIRYFVSEDGYIQDSSTDEVSPMLARYFKGYLGVMAEVDQSESGRYMAIIDMQLSRTAENDGKYIAGFIVKGSAGQRIDAYCAGEYFDLASQGLEGYANGMHDGTISDVATTKSAIVVGSYNSRNFWGSLDNHVYGYDGEMFNNNKISGFSSYGTLIDGRTLPTVCAPGATVISSSNEYYLQATSATNANRQAALEADGRTYSWHECVGTSMSSPLVAGSIALWLEADPTLTVEDVREIIRKTAKVDSDVTSSGNPVQWGAGKFDAYAGLQEVLRRSSAIHSVEAPQLKLLTCYVAPGQLEVSLPGAESLRVSLTALNGTMLRHSATTSDVATITVSGLPKGVYILTANNQHAIKITL